MFSGVRCDNARHHVVKIRSRGGSMSLRMSAFMSISVCMFLVTIGSGQAKTVASQSDEGELLLLRQAAGDGVFCVAGSNPEIELFTDIPELTCARETWGPKTVRKEDHYPMEQGRVLLRFEPDQMVVLSCQNQRSVKEEHVGFLVLGAHEEIDFCWPGSSRYARWTFFVRDSCDPEELKRDERVMSQVRRWAPHTYYCPRYSFLD